MAKRGLGTIRAQFGRFFRARLLRVSLVAILPILIVALAPALFGWRIVSPGASASSEDLREAVKVLGELSTDLASIAVAVLIGLGVLARERARRRISDRFLIVTIACAFFAILSVYASIRLRVGVAVQMLGMGFYFDKLVEQLLAQALSLVVALSLLVGIAASAIFGPERAKS